MKVKLIAIPIVLVATAAAASTFIRVRDGLAQQRNAIAAEWVQVNEALELRAAVIHNLAETAGRYTKGERDAANQIEQARSELMSARSPEEKIRASDRLSNAMAKLLATAEKYPRLRSDQNFLRLQDEVRRSEDRIAVTRLKYNDALAHYNARIQGFPHNFVARLSGFTRNDAYFQTERF